MSISQYSFFHLSLRDVFCSSMLETIPFDLEQKEYAYLFNAMIHSFVADRNAELTAAGITSDPTPEQSYTLNRSLEYSWKDQWIIERAPSEKERYSVIIDITPKESRYPFELFFHYFNEDNGAGARVEGRYVYKNADDMLFNLARLLPRHSGFTDQEKARFQVRDVSTPAPNEPVVSQD